MKHVLLSIISLLTLFAAGAEDFCTVRLFNEDDGLSQRLVKGVVQDADGVIWIATWNGLNRFDGNTFTAIRPDRRDSVSRYSSRIGDIKLTGDGHSLWLRVDGRLMRFDTHTHRFADTHSVIEQAAGFPFTLKQVMTTDDARITVLETEDSRFIILDGAQVTVSNDKPALKYYTGGNRKLGDVGPYRHDDLVLSRLGDNGTVQLITRGGDIVTAPSVAGPFTVQAHIDVPHGTLYYSTTDNRGNVWLRSPVGAVRVTFAQHPYRTLRGARPSMVRASSRDARGRVWLSESDALAVAVLSPDLSTRCYLSPTGALSEQFTEFGRSIYAITCAPDGSVWLGTKPDGLYRLTPEADGYRLSHPIAMGNIYDIACSPDGTLWVATMGDGVLKSTDNGLTFQPVATADARQIRHLVCVGDSLVLGASTSGLPAIYKGGKSILHVSEPGRDTSLGNVAVMDVAVSPKGRVIAATESDGLNLLLTPPASDSRWDFRSYNSRTSGMPDVTLSAIFLTDSTVLAVGNTRVHQLNIDNGSSISFGPAFWGEKIRFSDTRPLQLSDDSWLLGHDEGAVVFNPAHTAGHSVNIPMLFTSASIENRPDTVLTMSSDTLTLGKHDRNVTVRFSALDYTSASDLRYSFRLDGDDWTELGGDRAVTLLDLSPGTYKLTVRSTDESGEWLDNARTLTLIVIPTFWETGFAKTLYVLLTLGVIAGIIAIIIYIRRIRRRQHELLESYLALISPPSAVTPAPEPEPAAPQTLGEDDRRLMERVMEFVETHLGDSEVSVDDMAAAAAVSRSGLGRKMKSLMGVSPAEFLKESRLSRAATLLAETDLPIKDIAADCGFADLNYFGKCFKASRSITPGAYRKSNRR